VPKRLVDADGAPAALNNVHVSRIEDKMGCHGSPTCQMEFEGATGWLIGEENRGHANPNPNPNPNPDRNPNRNPDPNQENRGLNHMFTFINTSRVGTAVQGVAAAEAAFQNSLWYAEAQG